MSFPTELTNAVDDVTEIIAAHLNNLEAKVGIDGSGVATSLDYLLKNTASIDPGHKHSKLWASDGSLAAMTVDATGKVMVGSGTPAARLHIAETITTSPRGIISAQYNTGTEGARLHLRKARGSLASPTVVVSGDMLGRLVGSGYDGANYLEMAGIDINCEGTIGSTRIPTRISFWTATDAAPSVLTERMRIDSAGNVGIGTTTPNGKLMVSDGYVPVSTLIGTDSISNYKQGGSSTFSNVVASSIDGVYDRPIFRGVKARGTMANPTVPNLNDLVMSFLSVAYDGTVSGGGTASVDFLVDGAVSAGVAPQRISFSTSLTNNNNRTERLTIKSNGNVGIGTTTPGYNLHVVGTIFADSRFYIKKDGSDAVGGGGYLAIQNVAGTTGWLVQNGSAGQFDLWTISGGSWNNRLRVDAANGNVGIGTTTPNAAALLHLASTSKGFLPPVLTTAQKTAIGTPPAGLVVYDSNLNKLCVRTASAWETITSA